jgi:two-component system sensor histidine kinase UhpB
VSPGPPAPGCERRYVPLIWRVAALNAGLLVTAVIVTLLVLEPRKLSSFALDEAVVLVATLALVGLGNLILLRRVVGPITALTALARTVDLTRPGTRLPNPTAASEAGELAATFNEMLTRLEAERREATGRVLAGQEAERLRIAQELHDQIGQELTAVLLGLSRLRNTAPAELSGQVAEVQEAVRASLEDVRRIAIELRPEALDELGLVSALAVLGERFAERSGLTVVQRIDDPLPGLDPDAELVVYRVAQEALTNVARHSGALHATLSLTGERDGLRLEVADSGCGLPEDPTSGSGLKGMGERAALVGGALSIGPGPDGRGCSVRLTIAAHPPDSRP